MAFHQTSPLCSNCGGSGHIFRQCVEPVSSYGVLVFRWVGRSPLWTPSSELCKDNRSPNGLVNIVPEVLMIQRKDSLGFMDIMRGKYKLNEPDYIKKQLRGMTQKERYRLLNDDFETIWHDLWGSDMESSQRYAHDRVISKQKFTELRAGVEENGEFYTLADLLRQEPNFYETPEWGFPKGRRDPYETDIQCAFRELEEEAGITEDELWKVANVVPFIEQFYGSNDIHYRHSYYLAQYIGGRSISFDILNSEMTREIGNLAWKPMDEALILLRPDNIEKRGILIQLANLLRNFLPVFRDTMVGNPINIPCHAPNTISEGDKATAVYQTIDNSDKGTLLGKARCGELMSAAPEGEHNEQAEKVVNTLIPNGNSQSIENTKREQELYVFGSRTQRTANGRVDKSKRFFGARQTYRRIPDIYGTNQGNTYEGYKSRGATTGIGGITLSGYR